MAVLQGGQDDGPGEPGRVRGGRVEGLAAGVEAAGEQQALPAAGAEPLPVVILVVGAAAGGVAASRGHRAVLVAALAAGGAATGGRQSSAQVQGQAALAAQDLVELVLGARRQQELLVRGGLLLELTRCFGTGEF